ncbi:MAG: hypothetical protein JXA57_13685 [Armatimonadetes bacterium]|nr:hypothetical protein [Armatimonadota bacterium]
MAHTRNLLSPVLAFCLLLCGCSQWRRAGSPHESPTCSEAASAITLEQFLGEYERNPDICAKRIRAVGALRTSQAKEALLAFAAHDMAAYFKELADAFQGYGPSITAEMIRLYQLSPEKKSTRLTCAMTIARFSDQDTPAMQALIEITGDPCHDVKWTALDAVLRRYEDAIQMLDYQIKATAGEEERKRLEGLKAGLIATKASESTRQGGHQP